MLARILFILAWLWSAGVSRTFGDGPATTFRAGAAAVDITPLSFPVSMTGGFTDRQATQAHDPLHARALVLDDGATKLAFVICDSCLISREVFDEAKRRAAATTGIPATSMLMSATHTHTAVTALDLADCRADPAYVEFLTGRIAAAVEQAAARLRPARIGWGVGREPGEVFNRRWKVKPGAIPPDPFGGTTDQVRTNPPSGGNVLVEPAGPTDPEVCVLAVQRADGAPLAIFASYALHYVGNIPRDSLSADYFGEFAAQLRRRLKLGDDSPFVGMLANAASGDINNINFRNPQPRSPPMEQIRHVAGKVADAALAAYREIKFQPWVSLAVAEKELPLAVRRPDAAELERARAVLASTDGSPANTVRDVYARETLKLAEWPERVQVKLQALRIGTLGIVGIPNEPFCQIGLDIKQASPLKPTFIIGLANGYHCYLPTPEQHALGGYETWRCRWCYLEVNASPQITQASLELLQQVNQGRRAAQD